MRERLSEAAVRPQVDDAVVRGGPGGGSPPPGETATRGGQRERIGWSLLVAGPIAVALGAAWIKTSVSWEWILGLCCVLGGFVAAVLGAFLLARSGHAGTAAVGKAAVFVLGAIFVAVWASRLLD